MVNRRQFLASGIAVSALPVVAGVAPARVTAATLPEFGSTPLYKVIYDQRFPASVAYGRDAERRGFAVHAIQGDITGVWYDDLYPRWKKRPVAIAGLTAQGPLFCLERLSWDFGMRVTLREDRPGDLISWMIAPRGRGVFV